MMKKSWLIGGAILLTSLTWHFWPQDETRKSGSKEVPVSVIKAYRQELFDNVEALGTAYANESITVTATASETISEILFTDGQQVKKGEVIVKLEQREEQAQLAGIKAQIEEHKRELKRIESLLRNKAASQRDYDERKTLLQIAQKEMDAVQARVEVRTLRAPFDGTLGIRRLSAGALVQPGDIITTIDDTRHIKLDFTVPAVHLATLKPGIAIEARTEALGDRVFQGKIEQVDTRVDPITRSILVRAIVANEDGMIRPGLLMRVTLFKNTRNPIVAPEESVLQRQDAHFVLVVDPATNIVEERRITPGIRRPGILEVLEGLAEGELLIVRGVNRATPGKTVTIKETWDSARPPTMEEKPPSAPMEK